MAYRGLRKDVTNQNAALSALETAAMWSKAMQILQITGQEALKLDVITYNSAIAACKRPEHWPAASVKLARLRKAGLADVVSYNSSLTAVSRAGFWLKSLDFLDVMKENRLEPAPRPPKIGRPCREDAISRGHLIKACGAAWDVALLSLQEQDSLVSRS